MLRILFFFVWWFVLELELILDLFIFGIILVWDFGVFGGFVLGDFLFDSFRFLEFGGVLFNFVFGLILIGLNGSCFER